MSETKERATPGPWRYIDPRLVPPNNTGRRRPPEVVDANNNRVAQVDSRAGRHENGQLIAAAPLLADALVAIYVKLQKADWPDFDDQMDDAKAALIAAGRLP